MKSILKTAFFLSLSLVLFSGILVASFSGLFPQYVSKMTGIICLFAAACAVGLRLFRRQKDEDELVRGKIRRVQLEFLNDCFSRKLSRHQIAERVREKKDILSEQIKQSAGYRRRRKAAELDMLIESGWKDIIAVFSSGGRNYFSEYADSCGSYEDSSVILPERAADVFPDDELTEIDGYDSEELEELEEVSEVEPVDELEEMETELAFLEEADDTEETVPQADEEPVTTAVKPEKLPAAEITETEAAEECIPELMDADDDGSDGLLELEAVEEEDDLYDFASAPFFEPGRKYSLLKSVLLNDDVDENIQIMKSINESYADRKSAVLDSEVLEFSDPDIVQDETPDMSIADNFIVFTPYQPDATGTIFSVSQSGKETTDEMDTDAEDMELLPGCDRKPFLLIPFGAAVQSEVIDLTYEAVIEGADGVYHIADDLDTGGIPVDKDFKNLVDSVLKEV